MKKKKDVSNSIRFPLCFILATFGEKPPKGKDGGPIRGVLKKKKKR